MSEMARRIELMALNSLVGAQKNPKRHSDEEIRASIGRFGYVEPCVHDERTGRLVAGHGRVEALRAAKLKGDSPPQGVEIRDGEWFVPVLRGWASRSDTEAEAYLVASNQLTTKGGWDDTELASLLEGLEKQSALEGTGYSADDVDDLLSGLAADDKKSRKRERENDVANVFQVLVEVSGEDAQATLIDKLEKDGFKCRPLVF